MIVDVVMPRLGMTMDKGKVVAWNVKEGEVVQKGEPLLAIETEKVAYEIESPETGYLHILIYPGGEVLVGEVIGYLASTKEEYEKVRLEEPKLIKKEAVVSTAPPTPASLKVDLGGSLKVSGIARKIAVEYSLDLTQIKGSGPEGRIMKEDVLRALKEKETLHLDKRVEAPRPITAGGKRVKSVIKLTGMTKAMAEHMMYSLQTTAQVTNWEDVDMTEMIKLRQDLLTMEGKLGGRISYTDIFAKVACLVLKGFPQMNASVEGEEVLLWEDINLGIAVNLDNGLIVPVLHQANRKSLVEISKEVKILVEKAQKGTLTTDDVTGGTYTMTNLGAVGGVPGTPILVAGQMGIISFGATRKKPVVIEDQIVIRPILRFASTVDHRVITGVLHYNFRALWKQYLEKPSMMILGF